jgi:hypothetical protein
MAPALKAGQLVIGRQTRELSPGDVVIVSHRGLEKSNASKNSRAT